MNCTHQEESGYWRYDEWSGSDEWVDTTRSTYRDIDLHRYQCHLCGHIAYYSGAARRFHEKGEKSDIQGLDGKS